MSLYPLVRRSLASILGLFGAGPGGSLLRHRGVLASVAPAVPDRSLFNGVMFDRFADLERAYDDVAYEYDVARVNAFTVWLDPGDTTTPAFLEPRGHVLDALSIAMAAPLAEIVAPPLGDLDWSETEDAKLIGRINDRAYGLPPTFEHGMDRMPAGWRGFVARVAGEPVSCVMVDEADGDVGVGAVATLPDVRGQRVMIRLLGAVLADARRRGARTTSLQATMKGRGVYARLGYHDLGVMAMWERRKRRSAPPAAR